MISFPLDLSHSPCLPRPNPPAPRPRTAPTHPRTTAAGAVLGVLVGVGLGHAGGAHHAAQDVQVLGAEQRGARRARVRGEERPRSRGVREEDKEEVWNLILWVMESWLESSAGVRWKCFESRWCQCLSSNV